MRRTTAHCCAALAVLAVPATAAAKLPPPASGGAQATPPPAVTTVRCRSRCAGTLAQAGSTVAVRGSGLDGVVALSFLGGPLGGDEVAAVPASVKPRRVLVRVPAGAVTGAVMVAAADGRMATSPSLTVAETALPGPTSAPIATAVTLPKAFVDGERAPTLAYRVNTPVPVEVTVSVVREKSGRVVKTFAEGVVAPGETRLLSWGRRAGAFRFVVNAGAGASAAAAATPARFRVRGHKFPLRGRHDFGDGLGAGRGHQGTDVFAACGTPVVAARGGRVKMREFQSRAGNYVVIDEARSGFDSAYMHLRDAALVEQGDRVRTGELIGYTGATGAASECHLHFEYWTAPGWYSGGSPVDALSRLQAWDRFS